MSSSDDRIDDVLSAARALFAEGRVHDACLAFERVLLHAPAHAEARAALSQARAALAEEGRALDAQLREAQRLMATGEPERARPLLEEIVARGGDRDAARALLDRSAGGSAAFALPEHLPPRVAARQPRRRRRPVRSRGLLTTAWAALFVAVGGGVIARWDAFMAGLTATPAPRSVMPAVSLSGPTSGERALAEARTLLDTGDAQAALAALARVAPDDPAFPFATQMRVQVARTKQGTR